MLTPALGVTQGTLCHWTCKCTYQMAHIAVNGLSRTVTDNIQTDHRPHCREMCTIGEITCVRVIFA